MIYLFISVLLCNAAFVISLIKVYYSLTKYNAIVIQYIPI